MFFRCLLVQTSGTLSRSGEARGREPGWHLLIRDGRIDYTGHYGEKKISVARPDPRPSFNGRR